MPRRILLAAATGIFIIAGFAMVRSVSAQPYPSRPITVVVPLAAGGPVDALARILAERMRTTLGQPVIVENVSGAGGTIGVGRVARAASDGYTLIVGNWNSHVGSPAIYPVKYDIVKDFEPVSMLPIAPTMIVGKATLPANDVKELIAWLKANPGGASAGTIGAGSPSHVSGIFFQKETGTQFQFVPYRGAAPAIQDLVAGQIDLRFAAEASSMLPHLRSGKVKAFAVLTKTRWAAAPYIPTVDEAGVAGLHISVWCGLWAPKGTHKDIIAKLNAAVVNALADPIVRQRLADVGLEIPSRAQQTPEGLATFHKAEIEQWWPIIKAANIKVE
jgi:tripartite-type tricarboxylate transporter receptor subunit TctC